MAFRTGQVNTTINTCSAEEGMALGSVKVTDVIGFIFQLWGINIIVIPFFVFDICETGQQKQGVFLHL